MFRTTQADIPGDPFENAFAMKPSSPSVGHLGRGSSYCLSSGLAFIPPLAHSGTALCCGDGGDKGGGGWLVGIRRFWSLLGVCVVQGRLLP